MFFFLLLSCYSHIFFLFFFFFKQKTAYEMLRSLVGSEMCIRDRMYDYVCNANFSHYADEVVDASAYAEEDEESKLPKVLVRKINLYEDVTFLLGKTHEMKTDENGCEFPETIDIEGLEYTQVNFGETEISYLKATALDEPVYLSLIHISEP